MSVVAACHRKPAFPKCAECQATLDSWWLHEISLRCRGGEVSRCGCVALSPWWPLPCMFHTVEYQQLGDCIGWSCGGCLYHLSLVPDVFYIQYHAESRVRAPQHFSGSLAEMTCQRNTLCETCLCARFLLLVLNASHHYLEGWSSFLLECQKSIFPLNTVWPQIRKLRRK